MLKLASLPHRVSYENCWVVPKTVNVTGAGQDAEPPNWTGVIWTFTVSFGTGCPGSAVPPSMQPMEFGFLSQSVGCGVLLWVSLRFFISCTTAFMAAMIWSSLEAGAHPTEPGYLSQSVLTSPAGVFPPVFVVVVVFVVLFVLLLIVVVGPFVVVVVTLWVMLIFVVVLLDGFS